MAYGARQWAQRSFGDGGGALANAVPPPGLINLYAPGAYGASSIGVIAYAASAAITPGVIPPVVYTVDLTGSLPITGALGPKSQLSLVASMTSIGVLVGRVVSKKLVGSLTSAGSLTVRATGVHIAGQLTPAGTVKKLVVRTFTGSATPTGAVHELDNPIALTGAMGLSGSVVITRQPRLGDLPGTITPTAVLHLTAAKTLAANLFPHGSVSFGIQSPGGYAGTIAATGGLTLTYPGGMTGLASITPTSSIHFTVLRSIAGSITGSSSVVKISGRHLTGALGITALTRVAAQRYVTISGSIAPAGAFRISAQKRVAGSVGPTGVMIRTYSLGLASTITSAGSRTLEGPGVGTSSFLADEGTLIPAGQLTNTVTKNVAGQITPAATALVVYYEPTVLVPGFVYTKYRRGIPLP